MPFFHGSQRKDTRKKHVLFILPGHIVGGWNSVYTGIQPTIKLSTVLQSTGALDFSLHLNGGLDFSLQ